MKDPLRAERVFSSSGSPYDRVAFRVFPPQPSPSSLLYIVYTAQYLQFNTTKHSLPERLLCILPCKSLYIKIDAHPLHLLEFDAKLFLLNFETARELTKPTLVVLIQP